MSEHCVDPVHLDPPWLVELKASYGGRLPELPEPEAPKVKAPLPHDVVRATRIAEDLPHTVTAREWHASRSGARSVHFVSRRRR